MPASDICQPQVITALIKENWQIIGDQISLRYDTKRYVFVDLEIQHSVRQEQLFLIEVKCFNQPLSQLADFYEATLIASCHSS